MLTLNTVNSQKRVRVRWLLILQILPHPFPLQPCIISWPKLGDWTTKHRLLCLQKKIINWKNCRNPTFALKHQHNLSIKIQSCRNSSSQTETLLICKSVHITLMVVNYRSTISISISSSSSSMTIHPLQPSSSSDCVSPHSLPMELPFDYRSLLPPSAT